MQFILGLDKETKGSIRYGDGRGHNIYLTKEEAAGLGNPLPKTITADLTAPPVEAQAAVPTQAN